MRGQLSSSAAALACAKALGAHDFVQNGACSLGVPVAVCWFAVPRRQPDAKRFEAAHQLHGFTALQQKSCSPCGLGIQAASGEGGATSAARAAA